MSFYSIDSYLFRLENTDGFCIAREVLPRCRLNMLTGDQSGPCEKLCVELPISGGDCFVEL